MEAVGLRVGAAICNQDMVWVRARTTVLVWVAHLQNRFAQTLESGAPQRTRIGGQHWSTWLLPGFQRSLQSHTKSKGTLSAAYCRTAFSLG